MNANPPPPLNAGKTADAPKADPPPAPERPSASEEEAGSPPAAAAPEKPPGEKPQEGPSRKQTRLVSVVSEEAKDLGAAPATAEPSPDGDPEEWKEFVKTRAKGDEKLAKKMVYETEQRAAALAREVEELKATTKPAETAPAKVETEPEPLNVDAAIEESLKDFRKNDAQAVEIVEKFKVTDKRMDAILEVDPTTERPTGKGELPTVITAIKYRESIIADPEADELDKAKAEKKLAELLPVRERLMSELDRLQARRNELANKYNSRIEGHKARVRTELETKLKAETHDKQREAEEAETYTAWDAAMNRVAAGLSAEDRDHLDTLLLREALDITDVQGRKITDLNAWMEAAAKRHLSRWGKAAAETDVEAARKKDKDNKLPGPSGKAAVAMPMPSNREMTTEERFRWANKRTKELTRNVREVG